MRRLAPAPLVAGAAMVVSVAAALAPAPGLAAPPTAQLLSYLGLKLELEASVLKQGGVLHSAQGQNRAFPEEVAVSGAMLLVSASSTGEVIDAFLHRETFWRVHDIKRSEPLVDARVPALGVIVDLPLKALTSTPEKHLNLSSAELASFRAIDPASPDAAAKADAAIVEVLSQRLASFREHGLSGIAPYVRDEGRARNPAAELSEALRSLAFLANEFPGFTDEMRRPPDPGAAASHKLHWIETAFDGKTVLALSREAQRVQETSAIGADLHYYATTGYNAMLTVVGVVPYHERWLVFALNHTFTDEVLGFASGVKHAAARRQVAERLARHLEEVRRRVEASR